MVVEQVPGQGPHARHVVAAHVGRGGAGDARQGDDGDLPGDLVDLAGLEHAVVQDQPVALARDREDPAAGLVVGDVHRAQQQVEAAALRRPLDAPVEHVVELQRLGLVGERVVAEQPGGVPRAGRPGGQHGRRDRRARRQRPPHDHADDFLQPDGQRAGGAVRDVAELGDRPLHPVPDLRARVTAAVEHARHRGDGDPGGPCHVVDRGRGPARPQRTSHVASCISARARPRVSAFLTAGRGPAASPVSAYRPGRGSKRTSARPPSQGRVPGQRYSNVTPQWWCHDSRRAHAGSPDITTHSRNIPAADYLPRYRRRNKREMPPKPAHGKH